MSYNLLEYINTCAGEGRENASFRIQGKAGDKVYYIRELGKGATGFTNDITEAAIFTADEVMAHINKVGNDLHLTSLEVLPAEQ